MSIEIQLFPIFNHTAPDVWDDFCNVKLQAWRGTYGIQTSDQDRKNTMTEFRKWVARDAHTFAFGAYAGTQLVGYIRGTQRTTKIVCHDLYVLPEFQRMRIGRRLMGAVEQTYKLNTNRIQLLAMGYSGTFYQKLGFGAPAHDDNYVKILKKTSVYGTIPVFKATEGLMKDCATFNTVHNLELNKQQINDNRAPMFVYYDEGHHVDGWATMSHDGSQTQIHAANPWAQKQLTKAINHQKELMNIRARNGR